MFSLENRSIYKYHNGTKYVLADPLAIYRTLASFPDIDLDRDLKVLGLAFRPNPATDPGLEKEIVGTFGRLIGAIRQAFKVSEFQVQEDGTPIGLTEEECMLLLADYADFIDGVKKKDVKQPT